MRKIILFSFLASIGVSASAQTVVFQEDFNSYQTGDTPSGWTFVDLDGDGQNWRIIQFVDENQIPTGTPTLVSDSWDASTGFPLIPDNWAVTPGIDLSSAPTGATVTLEWKISGVDPLYANEYYSVYIAAGSTPSDFLTSNVSFSETVTDNGPGGLDNFYTKTLDASSFVGQNIHVAFRHHNSTDVFRIALDDISVYYTGGTTNPDPDPDPDPSNPPVAGFNTNDASVCEGACITFTDTSTDSPTSWSWSFPGGSPASSNSANPGTICYNTSGNYDVILIVTNADGSDTLVQSNYITVNAAPNTPTITANGNVLTSSEATGNQWYFNGTAIAGATSQTHNADQDGSYTVVVTNADGCSAESDAVTVSDSSTSGIEEVALSQSLKLYPNPSTGVFTVSSGNNEMLSLEIFDILGNRVAETTSIYTGENQINVSQLTKGIYMVKINRGNESHTERLILK